MEMDTSIIYKIIVFGLPIIIAITTHEAAHGYVALRYGDDTALRMGRVTFNPLKHIDPIGTVLLPGLLLLSGAPILFGYAKPVPVNFARLNNPRRDMVLVAAAGPGVNILLAVASALLLHLTGFFPTSIAQVMIEILKMSVLINVVLAVFNMLPLPPLDGGRVAVGLLPNFIAIPLAKLEPYGFFILIGLLFLPSLLGLNFSFLGTVIGPPVYFIVNLIAALTGVG